MMMDDVVVAPHKNEEKQCTKCRKTFPIDSHFRSSVKCETTQCKSCREAFKLWFNDRKLIDLNQLTMQVKNEQKVKQCSQCKKSFLTETHFQSHVRAKATKMCKLCRNRHNTYEHKLTSVTQKRRNIYISHKKNEIQKSRGCEWPDGCRFNFSDEPETFVVCDEVENIVIFEFDHLSQEKKLFPVSQWVNHYKYTEEDLVDEISKCRILCCFHHHLHSLNQQNEKRNNKSDYSKTISAGERRKKVEEKIECLRKLKVDPERFGKCEICKRPVLERETHGFDFDHIDPNEKHREISKLLGCSWENSILPEIDKCRLLCANCHRIHTQEQRQSASKNDTIICRKRKRYLLPRNINKEDIEIKIRENRKHVKRPPKDELYDLVKFHSFADVGKMCGVSRQTIPNWCKKEGIPHKRTKLMEELE